MCKEAYCDTILAWPNVCTSEPKINGGRGTMHAPMFSRLMPRRVFVCVCCDQFDPPPLPLPCPPFIHLFLVHLFSQTPQHVPRLFLSFLIDHSDIPHSNTKKSNLNLNSSFFHHSIPSSILSILSFSRCLPLFPASPLLFTFQSLLFITITPDTKTDSTAKKKRQRHVA